MEEEKFSPGQIEEGLKREEGKPEEEEDFESQEVTEIKRELKDVNNLAEVTKWFKGEIEDYVEEHRGYVMGHHYEELFRQLARHLIKQKGKSLKDVTIVVDHREKTEEEKENQFGEKNSSTNGTAYLMGQEILKYSYVLDGRNPEVDEWNDDGLKQALGQLIGEDAK